jgi:tetratricopeptide (TPR) repeat protein
MPSPPLKQVEDAAQRLVQALPAHSAGPDSIWQIDGVATAGKSSCLRLVSTLLEKQGKLKPVVVAPPAHNLDTGPAALADVAVGLAAHGFLNGELDAWSEGGASWTERIDLVRRCIADHDDVVLLCDEPDSWGANRGGDDFFAQRSFDVAFSLGALPCRRVVTGKLPVPVTPVDRIELEPASTDPSWLRVQGWGELELAAQSVADSAMLERPLTALQVRILVAATSLTSVNYVTEWIDQDGDGRRIALRFAELIAGENHYRRLWDAWLQLSMTRRAFDAQLLTEITPSGVTSLERDIIQHCLLFGDSQLRLHDVLRGQAAKWRTEHRDENRVRKLIDGVNRKLFEIHRQRFSELAANKEAQALTESMEAFHFASATGDSELIATVAPVFVEQLDALGWSLSYEHRDYRRAAKAFEQALVWDDTDNYAHHYLAYNLDRLGERVADVERHFRQAVALNGKHSWWRARLIIFLISRGRFEEAVGEWNDALLALGVDEGDASLEIYEHLHCWVSGAFLDAGEVRLAREVLDTVPPWAQAQLETYRGLDQRAEALLEVGDGDPVIPAWRLRRGWWHDGPELLQHRLGAGEQLVRWLAARVESKDENGINIRAAVLEPQQESDPSIAWSEIALDEFDDMCRDDVSAHALGVGRFLEVGIYAKPGKDKTGAQTIIRVLPDHEWDAPGPPALAMLRYLHNGAARKASKQPAS